MPKSMAAAIPGPGVDCMPGVPHLPLPTPSYQTGLSGPTVSAHAAGQTERLEESEKTNIL